VLSINLGADHDGSGVGADLLASHCEQGWLKILLVHDNIVGYAGDSIPS